VKVVLSCCDGLIWRGSVIWFGVVRLVRFGSVVLLCLELFGYLVWRGSVDLFWLGCIVLFGVVRLVWFGLVWFGLVWFGLVWFGCFV
jgi:hypothetical protein